MIFSNTWLIMSAFFYYVYEQFIKPRLLLRQNSNIGFAMEYSEIFCTVFIIELPLSDPLKIEGYEQLWLVGDNFVASTIREHFKKKDEYKFFIKEYFEVVAFCSSRFNDKDQNIIRRLKSTFATALSKYDKLPKYICIVLESDIIDFLEYSNVGISTFYGDMIESIVKSFNQMIEDRKRILPTKAKKVGYPQLYWVALPMHKNLDKNARGKFNLTLESIVKLYANMRIARIKDNWIYDSDVLVTNNTGRLTTRGRSEYWKAVDASLKFNIQKREKIVGKQAHMGKGTMVKDNHDEVTHFFARYAQPNKRYKLDNTVRRTLPKPKPKDN